MVRAVVIRGGTGPAAFEEPPKEILEHLSYDPGTGDFVWITNRRRALSGQAAGSIGADGYRRIKFAKRAWSAHRLAWLFVYGEWPQKCIDHINNVRSDNRIENLRLAEYWQNAVNTARSGASRGVTCRNGKYIAQITAARSYYHLGVFDTLEEAHAAYIGASRVLHGKFARAS